MIRLRNPRANVVYGTSYPVHPQVLEYYLQMLAGVPASHARARLTMIAAYDGSPRPLTKKILERPRLIERIRCAIRNPAEAYLTVGNATPLERKLAVLLGIPLNGCDPALSHLGSKSGGRKVLREAGVPVPAGFEDLKSTADIAAGLDELARQRPGIRRAIVKLNEGLSGEGNAVFEYPSAPSVGSITDRLANLQFVAEGETSPNYLTKFAEMGGVVEEFVEGTRKRSRFLRSTSCITASGPDRVCCST